MIADLSNVRKLATPFELVDAGSARSDLASRREIKYAFSHVDTGKLRNLLAVNCRRLVHAGDVSVVRSIYFDDARFSACRANLDGAGKRRKLRLRWYDSLVPSTEFYLEVKWRANRVTGKHRVQLRAESPLADMSYRQIRRGLEQMIPDHLARDFHKYNEPAVIVEYKREHFTTDDGLRLTLDYDVVFYDQTGRQAISTSFPRRFEGLVVIEGKTPIGRESELRRWLHPIAPSVGRCSKYVHGCVQLGLIHEAELI